MTPSSVEQAEARAEARASRTIDTWHAWHGTCEAVRQMTTALGLSFRRVSQWTGYSERALSSAMHPSRASRNWRMVENCLTVLHHEQGRRSSGVSP